MHKCYKCKKNKELSCFNKDSSQRCGYRFICKKCEKERNKKRYIEQKNRINKLNRLWKKNNKPKIREIRLKYRKTERGKFLTKQAEYRRRKLLVGKIDFNEWENKVKLLGNKCQICNKKFSKKIPACIDHIIPITKGGLNIISNVQPLYHSCNSKKGNKIL